MVTTPRRPDASMSLLSDVVETSLDPGYLASRGSPRSRGSVTVVLATLVLAGALFGVAVHQRIQAEPAAAKEREALIKQVREQDAEHEALRRQLTTTRHDVDELRKAALGPGGEAELTDLGVRTGAAAVIGPGVRIVVDDSSTLAGKEARVIDQDLRQLVNGLWTAGAEAIAINGHRISARTAIRGAGSAITVDYASLTRPYTVEAIGDPKTLAGRFGATSGAQWWNYLKQNYGMRYELATPNRLTLPADPRLRLTKAGPR